MLNQLQNHVLLRDIWVQVARNWVLPTTDNNGGLDGPTFLLFLLGEEIGSRVTKIRRRCLDKEVWHVVSEGRDTERHRRCLG